MIKAVIFDMFETLITLNYDGVKPYIGVHMAADAGISEQEFLNIWRESEYRRSIGEESTKEVLCRILKKYNQYSNETLEYIYNKRLNAKRMCFEHIHPEIIPMLNELKKRNIKLGLISNCFSEEAIAIRESNLFPFFDSVYLSCEQGMIKPNKQIYLKCVNDLSVAADECLYVGDGQSNELLAADSVNMKPLQAFWYISNPNKIQTKFIQLYKPLDIIKYL